MENYRDLAALLDDPTSYETGATEADRDRDRHEHGRGLLYDAIRELKPDELLTELSQVLVLADLEWLRHLITGESGLSEAEQRRIAYAVEKRHYAAERAPG